MCRYNENFPESFPTQCIKLQQQKPNIKQTKVYQSFVLRFKCLIEPTCTSQISSHMPRPRKTKLHGLVWKQPPKLPM